MYTQNELTKFSTYAERIHRLAMDIAMQAAQLGNYGKKVAFVADECRNIGLKFQRMSDQLYNGENICITECLLQLEIMAINGCIEALKIDQENRGSERTKSLAVIFDEILSLMKDIKIFFKEPSSEAPIYTPVFPKNSVLFERLPFLNMTICGQNFVENLQLLQEVLRAGNNIKGSKVFVRDRSIEIIDTMKAFNANVIKVEFFAIINLLYEQPESFVAVPLDCLPSIRWSDIGVNTQSTSNIPEKMIRECWNCEENQQMIFLNYKKF